MNDLTNREVLERMRDEQRARVNNLHYDVLWPWPPGVVEVRKLEALEWALLMSFHGCGKDNRRDGPEAGSSPS